MQREYHIRDFLKNWRAWHSRRAEKPSSVITFQFSVDEPSLQAQTCRFTPGKRRWTDSGMQSWSGFLQFAHGNGFLGNSSRSRREPNRLQRHQQQPSPGIRSLLTYTRRPTTATAFIFI